MQLDHPNIVKAYDLVTAEDVMLPPWMIVEYIPLNLTEALVDLSQHDTMTVMIHFSSALDYMHTFGITHDVKPDNALVVRDPELAVKLADFGTSKHNTKGKMDTFTGTETYMAPEIFEIARRHTNKVDMWSLGLIGMQLFTFWNPVSDDEWNPRDFGPWIRDVILPHMEEAPEQLRPLLKGLLLRRPNKRWSARKCTLWLWKHSQADVGTTNESTVGSRKRPASALDDHPPTADEHKRHASTLDDNLSTDDHGRHVRSASPSLSTARARAGSPLPVSAAPTPHPDDGLSDDTDGETDEDTWDGCDVEFEDDWKEDVE